ncbi:MAG TPA: hypothetical protein VK943_08890, partial [Arenibaculum sp.]|nr:hypothetical protein [Arenibaculum sp.]
MSEPEKLSLSGLSRGELEGLVDRLLVENAALKQAVAALRAEIARLKGIKGKPVVKPTAKASGMEAGTEPANERRGRRRRGRSGKVSKALAC